MPDCNRSRVFFYFYEAGDSTVAKICPEIETPGKQVIYKVINHVLFLSVESGKEQGCSHAVYEILIDTAYKAHEDDAENAK